MWQRRARAGWNLCVSGDGSRLGWVPDNRSAYRMAMFHIL